MDSQVSSSGGVDIKRTVRKGRMTLWPFFYVSSERHWRSWIEFLKDGKSRLILVGSLHVLK